MYPPSHLNACKLLLRVTSLLAPPYRATISIPIRYFPIQQSPIVPSYFCIGSANLILEFQLVLYWKVADHNLSRFGARGRSIQG